ncbi:MAG TPA: phosphate acyltransferase PlsX [Caulobacteraceae bacterium]
MPDPLVISIDAMGGDHGPSVVAPGVARAVSLLEGADVRFLLHGDEAQIAASVAKLPILQGRIDIRSADRVIANDEKPAQAMRRGKGTSMWNAVESVKSGEAHAAVSAGNTGALMAISKLQLRMIGDLERPALVASWPTSRGVTAVLDVGANIDCDAERLVDFAIMGAAFHRAVHKSKNPTVGVLNVGSEDEKGHDEVRGAHRILRQTAFDLDYRGFVEGDDIAKGSVDVVVTDGFTGNVAIKTAEGLARFFRNELRGAFTSTLMARLGALIARGSLVKIRERLDPSSINGGPFLGLNGIVVKSHGGADARGFAYAIRLAAELAKSDFAAEIDRNLKRRVAAAEAGEPAVGTEVKQTGADGTGAKEAGERSSA